MKFQEFKEMMIKDVRSEYGERGAIPLLKATTFEELYDVALEHLEDDYWVCEVGQYLNDFDQAYRPF